MKECTENEPLQTLDEEQLDIVTGGWGWPSRGPSKTTSPEPQRLSPDDVRTKYGRPATQRATVDAASKLKQNAQNYSEMATQLNQEMQSRPWWKRW